VKERVHPMRWVCVADADSRLFSKIQDNMVRRRVEGVGGIRCLAIIYPGLGSLSPKSGDITGGVIQGKGLKCVMLCEIPPEVNLLLLSSERKRGKRDLSFPIRDIQVIHGFSKAKPWINHVGIRLFVI
jgi:hypothetical protein